MAVSIQTILAVNAAKPVRAGCRILGHQGSSLTGRAAMVLSPSFIKDLAPQVRRKIIVVCGTNGKTTTNNLLCAALETEGYSVVCNRLGANMPQGIAAAFAEATSSLGRIDADYACLEVDEASAVHLFTSLQPDYMVLTNLFRDQLDRYGEIDHTMDLLEAAVREAPGMKLIINADDPLCAFLAQKSGNPYVSFGISERTDTDAGTKTEIKTKDKIPAGKKTAEDDPEKQPAKPISSEIREGRFCKSCGAPLAYDFFHFGQMGSYHCTSCDFRRPVPVYTASGIRMQDGLSFDLNKQNEHDAKADPVHFDTGFRGLYNLYNILAVWSALQEDRSEEKAKQPAQRQHRDRYDNTNEKTRIDSDIHTFGCFRKALSGYRPQFGRNEIFTYKDHRILLDLAKNPTGFNQNIDAMLQDRSPKDLIIVINDNDQDGIDVSWLWDVDFDRLADESVRRILVSGTRAHDMQLRLKYVDIPASVMKTPEEALRAFLQDDNSPQSILTHPKKNDAADSGKTDSGKTDSGKTDSGKTDSGKTDSGKHVNIKSPESPATGNLYVLVNYTALMPVHLFLHKYCKTPVSGEGSGVKPAGWFGSFRKRPS